MEILCILLVLGTLWACWWLSGLVRPEPYDWPVTAYRLKLWWRARRHPAPTILYRAALGRIPGETKRDWDRRRDADVG